jgi:threonine aldolase
VQFRVIGRGGIFDGDDVRRAALARGHMVFPPTTLVVVENTHNRAGGVIFPDEAARSVVAAAAELGLATYLDGARIFNVAAATGQPVSELAAGFDLVGVSLSKGLGCPCGSMLAGSARLIDAARRARRRFGGALRQSGILAAAGLYALDNNITRLATDHRNARLIAEALAGTPGIRLDLSSVQTNIVLFHLDRTGSAKEVVGRAKKRGVLIADFSPQTIRLATHHDVDEAQCREAADALRSVLRELA